MSANQKLSRNRLRGYVPTERFRQQGNGPEADFGGVRELHCNKQGVSQPESRLTTKLLYSRQNGT